MRPRIGLVLGGGGSRGIAHVGVLQVLEREGIPIDLIVGTSMGSIVGVLYALGVPAEYLARRLAEEMEGSHLLNMNLFSARSRQKMVELQLASALQGKTFADLSIPTYVMAVDMVNGQEVVLESGEVLPAVLASSAVPAVFPPVKIGDMELADGGVIDSLATHIAYQKGAEKIIAVDVYPPLEKENPWVGPLNAITGFDLPFSTSLLPVSWLNTPGIAASMWRSVRVMTWYLHQKRLQDAPPDVLLRPGVSAYGSLDFKDLEGPVQAGIAAAEEQLDAIRALVQPSAQP